MNKANFKWKLRYGDLVNAAKAIDELYQQFDKHDNISTLDDDGDIHHRIIVALPIDNDKLTELPKREQEKLTKAIFGVATMSDGLMGEEEENNVLLEYEAINIHQWGNVEAAVKQMIIMIEVADDTQKHVDAIMSDKNVKAIVDKHKLHSKEQGD